jgi:DNA-binding response OmpR family regulator
MDISLPRLDGITVMQRIRQNKLLRDVPVIFLSGHAEPIFRAEALRQGGDDYIVKPFTLGELERALERHIEKSATNNPKSFFHGDNDE